MEGSLFRFSANINTDVYIKDPESSPLGTTIIKHALELIEELGFEEFTFKKLAAKINSTEASIYRYFENKHKLLLYLTSWYWGWVEYQLLIKNSNIINPVDRLKNAISVLATPSVPGTNILDEHKLFRIICHESSKVYLVKEVDELNKHGVFFNYKKIVAIISQIILNINPLYPFPHMLATTIIEGIHHQMFFATHLPSLTDKNTNEDYLIQFYFDLAISNIQKNI